MHPRKNPHSAFPLNCMLSVPVPHGRNPQWSHGRGRLLRIARADAINDRNLSMTSVLNARSRAIRDRDPTQSLTPVSRQTKSGSKPLIGAAWL